MNRVRGALLGTVAAMTAVGSATAADLPVKAKPVEYVKICSLYGAGFYYIPGTDTCIRIGGYVRAETALNTNAIYNQGRDSSIGGANNRLSNSYTSRSRQDLYFDTRTATEYGVVRTFADLAFSWTSGSVAGSAPSTYVGDSFGGGTLGVYYAFIQFAGFTMGKSLSQFSAPWANYPGNNFDGLVGGGGSITAVNQFTYTADFGSGVSVAVSAQDQAAYYQTNIWNTTYSTGAGIVTGAYGAGSFGGFVAPDLVARVRVDQAWGLFQASFAAHDNHTAYYGATETTGHASDKWGWAAQLALSIKNLPTGAGDTINLQGVYTNGASRYNIQDLVPTSWSMYGGTGLAGAYQSLGIGGVSDAIYSGATAATGTGLELTTTYGFNAGYTHNWDPYWNTAVYGAWAAIRYTGAAKAMICTSPGMVALGITGTCNPDFNIAQVGVITRWTPVKNLTFSADVTASFLDQKYSGAITAPASAITAKPAAVYEMKDQSTVSMLLRAQRNW